VSGNEGGVVPSHTIKSPVRRSYVHVIICAISQERISPVPGPPIPPENIGRVHVVGEQCGVVIEDSLRPKLD
jgi:hypothetical protein